MANGGVDNGGTHDADAYDRSAERSPVAPQGTQSASPLFGIRVRSVFAVVAAIGAALVLRNMFERSTHVLGWFLAASVVAALVYPAVAALAARINRAAALLIVVGTLLATVGALVYVTIDDVRTELDHLQQVAPEAAQRLEDSPRWGEAARDFKLRDRVEAFVDELPQRLAGGDTAAAIRSATSRGAAYFVSFIFMIFLVLHGPRLVDGGLRQIRSHRHRRHLATVLERAYVRSWRYLVGTVGIACAAGTYTYIWCRAADLPGASVLAIFVALMSIVPVVGVVVGGIPIVVLALGLEPGAKWPWVLLAAFVGWQIVDAAVLRARLTRRSLTVGPAVTLLVGLLGIDLYGLGGALVGFAVAVLVVAAIDELAPPETNDLNPAVITS